MTGVDLGGYTPDHKNTRDALDILPAGWYAMRIIDSGLQDTKDGSSQYLKLTFEMLEEVQPTLKGRQAWERLNLWHAKPQTVEIAQKTLNSICKALGHADAVQNTNVLHNRPIAVKLKVKPAEGQYEAANDIAGYDAYAARFGAGAPVQAAATPPPGPVAPTTAPAVPPPASAPAAPAGKPPWQQ